MGGSSPVLKLFYCNVRSLKNKLEDIKALTEYSVICISETHLDNTIESGEILDQKTGLDSHVKHSL